MELDWIQFLNQTVSEDGIRFRLSPSMNQVNKNFEVFFKLTDSNSYDPMTREYEFTIKVLKPKAADTDEPEPQIQEEDKELLFVEIEAFDDQDWLFKISFSEQIMIPANYSQWGDSNEGADMLSIEFIPRTDTKTYLEDTDSQIEMTWKALPSAKDESSAVRRL